ncbi:MAG: M28 family peptidase [Candidatus Vogelbacteria bacterium]|nr:M28 family peptidase [Candidatus Vogelbacteria bacterium]
MNFDPTLKTQVKNLVGLSPRQGKNLIKTERYLVAYLKRHGIKVVIEKFPVTIPEATKASLMIDGELIPCLSCSFVGGAIENKETILSSTIPSRYNLDLPNINFNPLSAAICRNNFYFAPALAVARKHVSRIARAKNILGRVDIEKFRGQAAHLLVGNSHNPRSVVFAHYDSVGKGATDNASGVAVLLRLIVEFPETLASTLYVFDGNEELSYDYPTYWGHGFRVFEDRHNLLLANSEQIITVDCVGNGPTEESSDPNMLRLDFPIKNSAKWASKTSSLSGDFPKLMAVYHSDADIPDQLSEKYLREAVNVLRKKVG